MLERIFPCRNFEVKDAEGNTVTCADLTKDGKKILIVAGRKSMSLRNTF